MPKPEDDASFFNYDRMHTAHALIHDAQSDMMRCLYSGEVADVVQRRMVSRLTTAAEEIAKMKLNHG